MAMMASLSRRTVFQGFGSAVIATCAPFPLFAAAPKSLESIIGDQLIDRAQSGSPYSEAAWLQLAMVIDEQGRLKISGSFREALTIILNGGDAAEYQNDNSTDEGREYRRNSLVMLAALSGLKMLPQRLGYGHFCNGEFMAERQSFTVGDRWKGLGWPAPFAYVEDVWGA
ncbi:hypothetical protein CCR94_11315 [Rhodoblastus sphagnicola]|uniref:Uncharacterized protein n=1 Tax=Rhodoblastus sphagnicola TaxID=333368 RepID=A0A2S6N859_9HYPH|nr:hypothetical protein [Rhodoblastus sphagnicola]MBB4201061.1 hypothetical protein [Rhodoblastus sphagnicola]PPQ30794.1 hypothetical protein CCR94_11315 [Rhodoblastus sphagnicola]